MPRTPAAQAAPPALRALAAHASPDLARFRDALSQCNTLLAAAHAAGRPARELVCLRAAHLDVLLTRAWALHAPHEPALVAVGGYGRGELHPASDVDLMVLLPDAPDAAAQEWLHGFLTFLWDLGLEVGHSVRTPADCRAQALADVTVATNLMEARLLAGDSVLLARMRALTGPPEVWPSRAFFEAKRDEQRRRHRRFGDTAYNLEPNVKEGPGGLRDIQTVGWVAKRHFGAETLGELVDHGFLTRAELASLEDGQAFLWDVRLCLHLQAGRREDRLLFDHQRRLAQHFGYLDDDANLAVEKFMKRYYRAVMELERLNEMLLALFEEAIVLADAPREIRDINRRFRAVNGYLEVADGTVFRRNPFALLELFLILQQNPELKGVRAATIRLVRDHRYLVDEAFRRDIRARSLFVEILKQPRGVTHELRRMHRYGLLAEYLPVLGQVVGQMQYDLFHAYTVDEHSLFVVSELRGFAVPDKRAEHPEYAGIFEELPKPWLLYIAGLFHDIAKGRGGDHSELGASIALEFCRDHDLSGYDARLVAWLVRHHLLMSMTAQRRDISDPDVVHQFARTVGDRTHLAYLYLLTVADIRGTNPTLWNDWKATLLRDLYLATDQALRRGLENPLEREDLIAAAQQQARVLLGMGQAGLAPVEELWASLGDDYFLRYSPEEIAWHSESILSASEDELPLVLARAGRGGTNVFVYTPDQNYLFAATTSVLGRMGLNIVDARVVTADNGMTLDTYVVLELDGGKVAESDRLAHLRAALREALDAPGLTREQTDRRPPRRRLRHFDTPTEVSFIGEPQTARTGMVVVAGDRPGLLGRLGWALADAGVRLHNARISTIGERAEDVFYLTDQRGGALPDDGLEALRRRIVSAIEEAEAAAP